VVIESDLEHLPEFFSSHLQNGRKFTKLYEYLSSTPSGDDNLLIYIHRNEYERFPSAVRQAAEVLVVKAAESLL